MKANHERAPKSAAFVRTMREVFGAKNIKVEYVNENGLILGEPGPEGVIPVLSISNEKVGKVKRGNF